MYKVYSYENTGVQGVERNKDQLLNKHKFIPFVAFWWNRKLYTN